MLTYIARWFGSEGYGVIIDVSQHTHKSPRHFQEKVVTIRYRINGCDYTHTQVITNVDARKAREMLVVNQIIRIKYLEVKPQIAYIHEFDDPKYRI